MGCTIWDFEIKLHPAEASVTCPIIEISGLNNMINQPVYSYSSGMSMRLAFAVSMILEPELLILDEWLAVGDYQFQLTIKKKLNSFIKKTKALLFASHSLDQIKDICNRAIYMKKGEIIFDGSPKDAIKFYTSDSNK
jgi:ABC-type polysaccharide/polyol phosphate transport system ATPase subunit